MLFRSKQRAQKMKLSSVKTRQTGGKLVKELASLAELRKEGLLTEEEFSHAKAKLLELEQASLKKIKQIGRASCRERV